MILNMAETAVENPPASEEVINDKMDEDSAEEGECSSDEEEAVQAAPEAEVQAPPASEEKEDKENRSRHRSSKDSGSSSKSRLKKELDAEEEKKRLLKEKLRQLERQMADDDDEDEEDYESDDQQKSNNRKRKSTSPDRSRSPKRRRRSRSRDRGRDRDSKRRSRRDREKDQKDDKKCSAEICKQYMLGKCPKSPERCPYSHDCEPPKIMELCKFYLLERCAKKEKCLYLHKGFPCKYFHTGHRCMDDAESCKFSHDHLNDITRNILLKHLEAAPKEILGDFPRLTREAALALVFQTEAKHRGWLEEEGKTIADIEKAVGDAVIEEAKKQLPR